VLFRPPLREAEPFRAVVRPELFLPEDLEREGTFPPAFRASERPIAIACLRLFTVFPDRPDLSLPRFISCIARFTFLPALAPYFAITVRS
jgi:hypothetical protein